MTVSPLEKGVQQRAHRFARVPAFVADLRVVVRAAFLPEAQHYNCRFALSSHFP